MRLDIRECDVSADRDVLLAALRENFPDWGTDAKFDWLYREQPLGAPRVWVLDGERGRLSGVSSAFPREMRVGEGKLKAFVLGDFCIARGLRSLGPSIALQRAACAAVDEGEVDLWYDFPSRTMLAVYRRMGLLACGELVRMVCPLRADRYVERSLPKGRLADGVSWLGNQALSVRRAVRGTRGGCATELQDADFDREEVRPKELEGGVTSAHSPAYLNWRYRKDPRTHWSILVAKDGKSIGAKVAFRREGDSVFIGDAIGVKNEGFLEAAVSAVIDRAHAESAQSITVSLSDQHPWMSTFEKLGFHRREGAPMVAYARRGALEERPWFLMAGDRDF